MPPESLLDPRDLALDGIDRRLPRSRPAIVLIAGRLGLEADQRGEELADVGDRLLDRLAVPVVPGPFAGAGQLVDEECDPLLGRAALGPDLGEVAVVDM